ncbi:cyclic nucleotide-binding domain-containing protein [bacterium]|nr:cyclic nucleotide-binding domain-containing protein [bacterium]
MSDQKEYIKIVLSNFMFRELDANGFKILFENAVIRSYKIGDVILKEGDSGDRFCMVVSGSVSVSTLKDGIPTELARLETGAIIGEVAALTGAKRTATVTAFEETKVIFFHKDALEKLIHIYHSLKERFEKVIIARAEQTITKLISDED